MIILPGTKLDDSLKGTPGTYTDKNGTYSTTLSLYKENRIVQLKGTYVPTFNDVVIGIVVDVKMFGYELDLNSPYTGFLSNKMSREEFHAGDVISCKVVAVDEVKTVTLSEPRRLYDGEVIEFDSVKVPRIIGKNASMLNLIREKTKSDVFVGKNGRLYLRGGNTVALLKALDLICRESHLTGLTDKVTALLEAEAKN